MLIKSVLMDNNEGLYIDLSDIQARLKRLESSSSSVTDYPVKVKSPVQLGETKTFYAWKLSVIGETEVTRKVPESHIGGVYEGKYSVYKQGDAIPVYEATKDKVTLGSGTYTIDKDTAQERTIEIPIVADTYITGNYVGLAYGSSVFASTLPVTTDHVTGTTTDVDYKYATNETEVKNIDSTPYYNIEGSTDLHVLTTPKALKDTVTLEEDTSSTDTIYKKISISDIVFYTTELPDLTAVQGSTDSDFPLASIEVIKDDSWETTTINYRKSKSSINPLIYTNIPFNTSYTFGCTITTLSFGVFKDWLDDTAYRINGHGIVYGESITHQDTTVYVPAGKIAVYAYGWSSESRYYLEQLDNIQIKGTSYGEDWYLIDNTVSAALCGYGTSTTCLVDEQTLVASFEAYQAKYAANNDGNLYHNDFTDAPEAPAIYKAAQSMADKNLTYYAPANFFPENLAYKATAFSSVDTVSSSLNDRIAKTYFPLFMKNDAGVMKMLADVEYDVESTEEAPYYKIKEARYNPTLKGNSGVRIQLSSDIDVYSSYPTGFVDFAKFAAIRDRDTLVRTKFLNALGISSFVNSSISLERVPSLDTTTSCEGLIIIQQDADTYHSDYNGTEKVYYAPSAGTEDTMDAVVNAERSSVVS